MGSMISKGLIAALPLALGLACAVDQGEEVETETSALKAPCVVLCIEGYHQAPNACVCVPDHEKGPSCNVIGLCVEGYRWSEQRCGCVPDRAQERCGDRSCGAGEYCCNASCGICAPEGYGCVQIACEPTH